METQRMEQLYQEGATLVNQMIPEAWDRFYLYAEVSKESRKVFFYYYPEGDNTPVYSLDIEDKFEIDEDRFNDLDDALYDCFTELWHEFIRNNQEPWKNLTFFLDRTGKFKIDFKYEFLSEDNDYENLVLWTYQTLGIRIGGDYENQMIESYIQRQQKE